MLMNPLKPSQYVVRWKIFIDSLVWVTEFKYAGSNGRVFVKDQSGPHGNETTFILAQ